MRPTVEARFHAPARFTAEQAEALRARLAGRR
jgi:hypothetical protein